MLGWPKEETWVCTQTRLKVRRWKSKGYSLRQHAPALPLDTKRFLGLGLGMPWGQRTLCGLLSPCLWREVPRLFKFAGCLSGMTCLRRKLPIPGKWLVPPGHKDTTWSITSSRCSKWYRSALGKLPPSPSGSEQITPRKLSIHVWARTACNVDDKVFFDLPS